MKTIPDFENYSISLNGEIINNTTKKWKKPIVAQKWTVRKMTNSEIKIAILAFVVGCLSSMLTNLIMGRY